MEVSSVFWRSTVSLKSSDVNYRSRLGCGRNVSGLIVKFFRTIVIYWGH